MHFAGREKHVILNKTSAFKIRQWVECTNKSQTLWISSSFESSTDSTAKRAAQAVASTAFQTNAPFTSHFCRRPRKGGDADSLDPCKTGLTGLVYSLIFQRLQFQTDALSQDLFDGLRTLHGQAEQWLDSLRILARLLCLTPDLQYCIIHGINDLEVSEEMEWTKQVLQTLLDYQTSTDHPFTLLFTTSGQSRALGAAVPTEQRYREESRPSKEKRRGQHSFGRRV